MGTETANTAQKSNKNTCLQSQELDSIQKCSIILVTRPSRLFEDLT